MANGNKPIYITRSEFYAVLIPVWVYIMCIIGRLLPQWRWFMGLLWVGSFFMVVFCAVQGFRSRKARKDPEESV